MLDALYNERALEGGICIGLLSTLTLENLGSPFLLFPRLRWNYSFVHVCVGTYILHGEARSDSQWLPSQHDGAGRINNGPVVSRCGPELLYGSCGSALYLPALS